MSKIKKPITPAGKQFAKDFKKTSMIRMMRESNNLLTEKEKSFKKKIFNLAKMEALVRNDQKLSAIYNEMKQDADEKYGYHWNETVMNIIFNEHVLNDIDYLIKYRHTVPAKKRNRNVKVEETDVKIHNNSLSGVVEETESHGNFNVVSGFGYDQERDGNRRIEKFYDTMDESKIKEHHLTTREEKISLIQKHKPQKYSIDKLKSMSDAEVDKAYKAAEKEMGIGDYQNEGEVDETTRAASSGAYAPALGYHKKKPDMKEDRKVHDENKEEVDETTTASSSGAYSQPAIWAKSKESRRFSKNPAYKGGSIVGEGENHMVDPSAYKRLIESIKRDKQLINEELKPDSKLSPIKRELKAKLAKTFNYDENAPNENDERTINNFLIQKSDQEAKKILDDLRSIYKQIMGENIDLSSLKRMSKPELKAKAEQMVKEMLRLGGHPNTKEIIDVMVKNADEKKLMELILLADKTKGDKQSVKKYMPKEGMDSPNNDSRVPMAEDSMIDDNPDSMVRSMDEDGHCRADEKPVVGKMSHEKGSCEKKVKKSKKYGVDPNKFNVDARKERLKKYEKGLKQRTAQTNKNKKSVTKSKDVNESTIGGFNINDKLMDNINIHSLEYAVEEAMESSKDGSVQHVNNDGNNNYSVDYFFDQDSTVLSFVNGRITQRYEENLDLFESVMNEDRKTPSQLNLDKVKSQNDDNFKKDLINTNLDDLMDIRLDDQYTDIDDPKELSQKIEAEKLKQHKGESFENIGDSTSDNNKEIKKRNLTDEEADQVSLDRGKGMHDIVYDNEPSERFEERMKADMGDQFYELRKKKMEYRAKAPMYNKDSEKVDTGINKVQYNKEKSGYNDKQGIEESTSFSGKYTDKIGKTRIITFDYNNVKISKLTEGMTKINTDGFGNGYTSKVELNEAYNNAVKKYDFYIKNDYVVKVLKNQSINENTKNIDKMKHLWDYDPKKYINGKSRNNIK